MKRAILPLLLLTLVFHQFMTAQVIWADPAFPTASQPVTIYFNATQGSGGLAGCNCDVYVHTGVVTSLSTPSSIWQHVVTSWGVANANWKMEPVPGQPDVYSYVIDPSIKEYYGVTSMTEVIQQMAFVFRNANGTMEGKDVGNTDIFYDVYPDNADFTVGLLNPGANSILAELGQIINVQAAANEPSDLSLFDNGNLVFSTTGTSLQYDLEVTQGGTHIVEFTANNGVETKTASFTYTVPLSNATAALPAGAKPGINYLSDTEVLFAFVAPDKENAFLIGDFNDWAFDTDFQFKQTPDGETWWLQIGGLTPGQQYAFQYVVDGTIRIGDPYSDLILDPSNDNWIPQSHFPNIHPYPTGKTTGIVSLMQPGAPAYDWQVDNFQRPAPEKLVVYELLLRDFLYQDYQGLESLLDYFEQLGINAIELMPVNEFDGNLSWGYNPTYHYALDKYYGTPDAFRSFVDACHARGIAVILDVVFNHTHEKNPLAMLYWDAASFKPAADNPWLNVDPKHDFNVFFDFNHESVYTKNYVKQTLRHWVDDYRVDGFRFDLSKGFTQKLTIGNVGAWGQYDASRVAIWKDYADDMWANDPDTYVILEHFADNSEEKELANYGMMLWGNGNCNYNQATMGYPTGPCNWDFRWSVDYKQRGWDKPLIMSYMESHDEERLMWKNLEYGNSAGSYMVKNLPTALDRIEQANAFFYTMPGPKMLWQFGELGYDYSINWCTNGTVDPNCRLTPKPIRWDYAEAPDRVDVYNSVRSLLYLRNNYEAFQTSDYQLNVGGATKTIHLNHPTMDVAILGNFDVVEKPVSPQFQHTGWWYDYISGDSLNVADVNAALAFQPGEYRLYTDIKILKPDYATGTEEQLAADGNWSVFPNPSDGTLTVRVDLKEAAAVELVVHDMQGRPLALLSDGLLPAGVRDFQLEGQLPAGLYTVRLVKGSAVFTKKLVVLK
ncbi:MAG: alpha-amylase family glycosyl hydrolase [Saprospiraceae bacterium]